MNRSIARLVGATAAAGLAGLAAVPAAFAADGPGVATASGWTLNVTTSPMSVSPFGTSQTADSKDHPVASATGKVGLTVSGRANISTGLQYVEAQQYPQSAYKNRAYVQLDVPVTGTTGAQTYSASTSFVRATCLSDAQGTPSGSTEISAVVPALLGIGHFPAAGTTVYFDKNHVFGTRTPLDTWEMKVVWNEQSRLANGQLRVVGMHTYYNVPKKALSAAITGDVALGIVTCGKVNDAPDPQPIPVADPTLAGGAAAVALVGGYFALRRREDRVN